MKVIFLDIDGVLNSQHYFETRNDSKNDIDDSKLPLLKQIVDSTGAKIVLSSSWRYGFGFDKSKCLDSVKDLIDKLALYGLTIYDVTPIDRKGNRCKEINKYLHMHNDIDKYVVIDDDSFEFVDTNLFDNFVHTSWYKDGIEKHDVDKAISILNS